MWVFTVTCNNKLRTAAMEVCTESAIINNPLWITLHSPFNYRMLAPPFAYRNDKKHSSERALFVGGMCTFTNGRFCASSKTDILVYSRTFRDNLYLFLSISLLLFFSFLLLLFLHTSKMSIPFKIFLLNLRLLMSYIHGAHIFDVSRSHTTTQHSR
jgi:hypothetical protein